MVASPTKLPDPRLADVLGKRLLRSEGQESCHCFISEPPSKASDAPASPTPAEDFATASTKGAETIQSSYFSLDTPPGSPRADDRLNAKRWPQSAAQGTPCDDTDHQGDDQDESEFDTSRNSEFGSYEWQFELLNSLPRERALELASALKKSEKASAANARLRQEVSELRRRSSTAAADTTTHSIDQPSEAQEQAHSQRSSRGKWLSLLGFVLLLGLVAVGFALRPSAQAPDLMTKSAPDAVADEPKEGPGPVAESRDVSPDAPRAAEPISGAAEAKHPLSAVMRQTHSLTFLHPALSEDSNNAGDVSAELSYMLQSIQHEHPTVSRAIRLGQIFVLREATRPADRLLAQSFAHIFNDGLEPWPADVALRLVLGPGWGATGMAVGQAVPVGLHIEMLLDLDLSDSVVMESTFHRSAWILEAEGRPFGPLFVLDVIVA